ncbi:hypothetical protein [Candidatus Bandiella euplotis]|nr:hypothetical protein [Candidatus Bandiella woodruffii]
MEEVEDADFAEDKEAYMAYSTDCEHQQKLINIILDKAQQERKKTECADDKKAITFAKNGMLGKPLEIMESHFIHIRLRLLKLLRNFI